MLKHLERCVALYAFAALSCFYLVNMWWEFIFRTLLCYRLLLPASHRYPGRALNPRTSTRENIRLVEVDVI